MVHLCRAEKLAKFVADLWDLFRSNACTAITNLNFEQTFLDVIPDQNTDIASSGKFYCILKQVY